MHFFYPADRFTLSWRRITQDEGGGLLDMNEVSYRVYFAVYSENNFPPVDPAPELIANVTQPEDKEELRVSYSWDLPTEGQFVWGVSTVRTVDGGEVGEGPIQWADMVLQRGVQYLPKAKQTTDLRASYK